VGSIRFGERAAPDPETTFIFTMNMIVSIADRTTPLDSKGFKGHP
jgi:hypothetical protein